MAELSETDAIVPKSYSRRSLSIAFVVLVVATALPYTNILPQYVSYGFVIVIYGLILFIAILAKFERVSLHVGISTFFGLISLIYLAHLYISAVTGNFAVDLFVRVPVFVILTGINLFYLPQVIPRQAFFKTISTFATVLIILAIPTLFVTQYGIGPIEIAHWRSPSTPLPGFGTGVHSLTSVFRNPNTLSFISAIGLIVTVGKYLETRHNRDFIHICILAIGLYLAHGRAAMGGAVVGMAVVIGYRILDPRKFRQVVIISGLTGFVTFLAMVDLIPAPSFVSSINLAGRIPLWEATIRAVSHRPFIGYGPGNTKAIIAPFVESGTLSNPHNSYLRMFLTTGLVGGFSYLLLVIWIPLKLFFQKLNFEQLTVFALCITIGIIQIFDAFSAFGISILSFVTAMVYGYGIQSFWPNSDAKIHAIDQSDAGRRS